MQKALAEDSKALTKSIDFYIDSDVEVISSESEGEEKVATNDLGCKIELIVQLKDGTSGSFFIHMVIEFFVSVARFLFSFVLAGAFSKTFDEFLRHIWAHYRRYLL